MEERNRDDIRKEFEAVKGRIREIKDEAENQFSQICDLINRLIGDRGMTLADKVKAIFREQGVTLFAVFTAIGAVIASIIKSLGNIPAKITQSSGPKPDPGPKTDPGPKPDPGLKTEPMNVLDSLKDGLRWLAEKAAAALPGILGSIISWIFRVTANVVNFLAKNLWLLSIAAAGLIISVVNKYNQKR